MTNQFQWNDGFQWFFIARQHFIIIIEKQAQFFIIFNTFFIQHESNYFNFLTKSINKTVIY